MARANVNELIIENARIILSRNYEIFSMLSIFSIKYQQKSLDVHAYALNQLNYLLLV